MASQVELEEFSKALASLRNGLMAPKNDLSRDASIQRFEFCVELAWKTARRVMGTATSAPKAVVREMARNGLIDDAEFWLLAIEKRNLSAHTYRESLAEEVYSFATLFLPKAADLLVRLKGS